MAGVKRSYHAPVRAAQATQTRERVIAAGADLFARRGWVGTTVADVADAAGVTPQAVHNSVGGKSALLIEAVRAAIAGDEADKSLAQRAAFEPAYRAQATAAERAAAFAQGARAIYERAAPLFVVLGHAAPADDALAELWHRARANRLEDCLRLISTAGRRSRSEVERRADLLFVYSGPNVYADLVGDRGWSADAYEVWLAARIADLLH